MWFYCQSVLLCYFIVDCVETCIRFNSLLHTRDHCSKMFLLYTQHTTFLINEIKLVTICSLMSCAWYIFNIKKSFYRTPLRFLIFRLSLLHTLLRPGQGCWCFWSCLQAKTMSTTRTTLLHVNYTLCAENPVAFGIHNTFAFNCKGRVGGNRETVGEDV